MNNTDFDLERINCNCTYKEIFDFYRIDEDTNDILNDPNFIKTKQWSANGEIIKCLKKIDIKEGLFKNEAFYFSGVIMVVELSMVLVSAIQGVKTVASFTKAKLNMNLAKDNIDARTKNNSNGINSANRFINNPPKKENDKSESNDNDDNNNDDDNNKKNILIKKNEILNYFPYKDISKNEDINNNNTNNVNKIIKKSHQNNKKKVTIIDNIYNRVDINSKSNIININRNKKAEFIPPEYNFKFFKPNDKGIHRRIRRSQIPFKIQNDTNILLEYKNNVSYHKNYLEGPFYEEQNLLEIIEDSNLNGMNNNNKIMKLKDNVNYNMNDESNNIMIRNIENNIENNDLIQKEEIYKSNKRNIPNIRINNKETEKVNEKDFIKITKINPIINSKMLIDINSKEKELKKIDNKISKISIYFLMKREHTYLRVSYKLYASKMHPNNFSIILAEIFDKIYFIKIFILLKKFDIFSVHLSLYMFYHILLLSLICGFFTIKTIKKIWEEDFPKINFYLLYGFISNVIIWIIYKIFIVLLDNQDRIRSLVLKNSVNISDSSKIKDNNNEEISNNDNQIQQIKEKYDELIKKVRIQMAVLYIVILIFTGFCSVYLISFCAFYTGTKRLVFKAYYISIIEIIIIKFVYGLSLASLRIAAEGNKYIGLYNFVCFCDKFLS